MPDGVHLVKSFYESLRLSEKLIGSGKADEVFVVGGSLLYAEALEQKIYPVRLYYTHIMREFDCDVFFPTVDWKAFKPIE